LVFVAIDPLDSLATSPVRFANHSAVGHNR
jgi:hypothetical protein